MNNGADFQCPLTGLPMNGRYRFSAFRGTGLVVSEKALKEVCRPHYALSHIAATAPPAPCVGTI